MGTSGCCINNERVIGKIEYLFAELGKDRAGKTREDKSKMQHI